VMSRRGGRLNAEQVDIVSIIRRHAYDISDLGNPVAARHAAEIISLLGDLMAAHREAPIGHGYDSQTYEYVQQALTRVRADREMDRAARRVAERELMRVRDYVRGRKRHD